MNIIKMTFLLFVLPLLATSQSAEKNFIDQNYIEVSGKAEKEISPDLIYLNISVSERDSKTKAPIAQTEKSMIARLTEIGIDASKDLVVRDLSSYQNAMVFKTSIDLQKQYVLTTHSAKQAGQVMMELEKLGISNIRITKVDHTKMAEYKSQARIEASKAAREKAEGIAKALNQTIGRAIFVSEVEPNFAMNLPVNSYDQYQYRYKLESTGAVHRGFSESRDNEFANIGFETIKIDYTIFVKFELK